MTAIVDPRAIALGVYVEYHPEAPYQLLRLDYQDPSQAGGNHNIYFNVLDEQSRPIASQDCYMDWNGRVPREDDPTKQYTDPKGQCNMGMYANLDIHLKNGAYFAYVGATVNKGIVSNIQSDIPRGMGLPEHQHVNFILTFQKGGVVPPPLTGQWVATKTSVQVQNVSETELQVVTVQTLVKQ